MAKKVIDIFPPRRKAVEADKVLAMPLPADLPDEESAVLVKIESPQTKPKITFNHIGESAGTRSEIFAPEKKTISFGAWFWKAAGAAAIVLAGMYFWDAQFAGAVVKIWPETSAFSREALVLVDSGAGDIDLSRMAIPGFSLTAEKSVEGAAPATGTKGAQGRARGSIKIFNNYTNSQTLIKNTRFQAPLDKFQPALEGEESPWFTLDETIVLPPKTSAVAQVTATAAGEKYNIEPSVFSVPGLAGTAQYTFIYAQSFEKFTGGSSEIVPQVTKDDLKNAEIEIQNSAKEEIKRELFAKAKEQGLEILGEESIVFDIGAVEISAKEGDNIAKIAGRATAKASAVAYKKSDFERLGKEFILREIDQGTICREGSFSFVSSYAGVDKDQKLPSINLAVEAEVYAGTDPEDLKKGLSEKKAEEAEMFLMSRPGMRKAEIRLSPPWRFSVPRSLDRIEIQTIFD